MFCTIGRSFLSPGWATFIKGFIFMTHPQKVAVLVRYLWKWGEKRNLSFLNVNLLEENFCPRDVDNTKYKYFLITYS